MSRFARLLVLVVVAAGLIPAGAQALPSCESAPCASDRGRTILLLSYYRYRDLRKLTVATRRAGLPPHTPVYYGGYWGKDLAGRAPSPGPPPPPRPGPRRPRPKMPGRRYAPIFTLTPTSFWRKRGLGPDQRRMAGRSAPSVYRGRIPGRPRLWRGSGRARYRWGVELGRRYRDRIRYRRAKNQRVVTWQLDELVSEIRGRGGYKRRQFVAGVLRGLTYGRPGLGDRKLPGIVWATGRALSFAGRPGHRRFWRTVDDSALYLVGEEYPQFAGSPGRAARQHAKRRARMWRRGGARRRLARRYVVGMTPGHLARAGLGGNVNRRRATYVRRWRLRYVRARAQTGPAGLAQYNFTFQNARYRTVRTVIRTTARGIRIARRR